MAHSVVVVFESSAKRVTSKVDPAFWTETVPRFEKWLQAVLASVQDTGVCRSFTIGVHVDSADCDHEVQP